MIMFYAIVAGIMFLAHLSRHRVNGRRFTPARKLIAFIIFASIAWFNNAHAETVLLTDLPAAKISKSDAGKSKTPVWECEKVKSGPRINPVKVPNSTSTYHTGTFETQEAAGSALLDGKTAYRCKTKQFDLSTGRMKSATL